jgi:hypothetical protein
VNRFTVPLLATLAASVASVPLAAQATITPVAGFGTGGWLAPGAIPQLDTSNSQRGMAVNPATGNIILVDRDGTLGNNAWVIDGATGTVLGSLVPPAGGYSGGTFVVNIPGCGSDGSIHVCNLVTSTASTYKVYSWVSEADGLVNPATTNVSAAGASGSWGGMNRIGDCFTVTGGGASPVQFVSAGSNSAAGTNSAFLQGLLDGSGTVTPYTNVPGTVTSSNGYRLGLTYVDDDTFIGTQGTTAYVTSFDGTSATLDASIATGAAQRPMAYAVISGKEVLATVDSNSSTVFIYDITDPSAPSLLVSGNATTGTLSANANGTGGCGWGAINGDTGTLYAMSSNQGIQAFTVTVPPPKVVINEVYYDAPGVDDGKVFVEIFGPVGTDVSGFTIQSVEGAGTSAGLCNPQSFTFPAGTVIPASGVLVVADATSAGTTEVANADFTLTNFDFENGADAVQLLNASGVCVDAVAYGVVDTSVGAASGCNGQPWFEGNPARDVFSPLSIERCPAGTDTDDNDTDFTPNVPTPGVASSGCQAIEFVSLGTGSAVSASGGGAVGFDFFITPGAGLPYLILAAVTDPATQTPPLGLPVFDGSSPFWLDACLQGGQFVSWFGTLPANGRSVGQARLDFSIAPAMIGASFPVYVGAVAYDASYNVFSTNAVQITINP